MSDPALQLSSVDNMLPLQGAQGAAVGGPQGLAAHDPNGEGRFSSVLKDRMQAADGYHTRTLDRSAEKPPQVARVEKGTGSSSPQHGNPLPLQDVNIALVPVAEITGLDEISGFPVMPLQLLPEVMPSELLVEGQSDPAALADQGLASLNGLMPLDLTKPDLEMLAFVSQSPDSTRQLPVNLEPLAFQQGKPGAAQRPLMQNPLIQNLVSPTLVDGHGSVEELVPVASMATRPLTGNERLLLERVRSTAAGIPQGASELADKGLSSDLVSLAGLDDRRAMLATANGSTSAALNQFKPVMEQMVQPLQLSSGSGDENVYSQLMGGVQRTTGTVSAQPMPVLNVATTVGQQGWSNEMSQRVTWMANNELREAQIQLNPRHLGPLEVRISFGQEQQLNVNFTVSNPMARDAVDAAMPRLREMLEQQGMNLGDANVSQESFAERQRRQNPEANAHAGIENDGELSGLDLMAESLLPIQRISEGMLDTYA